MRRITPVCALIALLLAVCMPALASGWVATPIMTKGDFTVKMDGTTFAEGATRPLAIGTFATFECVGTDTDTYNDPLPANQDGVHATWGFGADWVTNPANTTVSRCNDCAHTQYPRSFQCRWTSSGSKNIDTSVVDDGRFLGDNDRDCWNAQLRQIVPIDLGDRTVIVVKAAGLEGPEECRVTDADKFVVLAGKWATFVGTTDPDGYPEMLHWSGGDTGSARQQDYTYKAIWNDPGEYKISIWCDTASQSDKIEKTVYVIDVKLDNPKGDATKTPGSEGGPKPGENEFTFASGKCDIPCKATVGMTVNDTIKEWADANILWAIDPGVAGSAQKWIKDGKEVQAGTGLELTLRFEGMPELNTSFGTKTVTMSFAYDAEDVTVDDPQTAKIRIFYAADDKDHPGVGQGVSPNWFYYYTQTSASVAGILYDPQSTGEHEGGYEKWIDEIPGVWPAGFYIFVTSSARGGCPPTWGDPIYIDAFAWTCRHENKHRDLDIEWWGADNNNPYYYTDCDLPQPDGVPGELEDGIGRRHYDPTKQRTFPDDVGYGDEPMICDDEDICMRSRQYPGNLDVLWTNGSANDKDWANKGKNYTE